MLIPSAVLIVPGESNEVTFVQRKGVVDKNRPDFFNSVIRVCSTSRYLISHLLFTERELAAIVGN